MSWVTGKEYFWKSLSYKGKLPIQIWWPGLDLSSDTCCGHSVVAAVVSTGGTVHVAVLQCPQVFCSKTGRKCLC